MPYITLILTIQYYIIIYNKYSKYLSTGSSKCYHLKNRSLYLHRTLLKYYTKSQQFDNIMVFKNI